MAGYLEKIGSKFGEDLYLVFRAGIGVMFILLGIQKIFGLWGMPGGPAVFLDLVWFAGIFEMMIGTGMLLGVLVRLASFFGVIMMIVAYIIGHVMPTGSWNPAENFGVAALSFALSFLISLTRGAGKASLEKKLLGKELF